MPSIPRYLHWPIYWNNRSHLPNMQPKSNLSQWPGDLSNAQLTEIRDVNEHWITLNNITFVVGGLNYLDNYVIPYA